MNSKANAAPELRLDNPFVSSDKAAEPSSQYESAMARGCLLYTSDAADE